MTCEDLSAPGWRFRPCAADESTAVVGGRPVACAEISGILTRLPCVSESELPHIAGEDRAYVAAEMGAFLKAWLAAVPCPVLNRPRADSLSGPYWHARQWCRAASNAGLQLAAPTDVYTGSITITVVGRRCFGGTDPMLFAQAHALAAEAGVDLLDVSFRDSDRGPIFAGAHSFPALRDAEISAAVAEYLTPGARRALRQVS
jgi:hypothetical protein